MGTGGRLLVMGDVHGQYSKMQKALALADYDPARDRLVLLGDYIDRGPESWRVVEAVLGLVAQGAVALYGNHEDMMLRALANRNRGRLSGAKRPLRATGTMPRLWSGTSRFSAHCPAGMRNGGSCLCTRESGRKWRLPDNRSTI